MWECFFIIIFGLVVLIGVESGVKYGYGMLLFDDVV